MATTTNDTTRTDIYTTITNRIVEQLERGVRPWLKPWNAEHAAGRISRPLRHCGKPYSGINVIVLWMTAEMSGFVSPFWLTFRQALELGRACPQGGTRQPGCLRDHLQEEGHRRRRRGDRTGDSVS